MPTMEPIATQVKPPDFSQGVSTISGLLGLQQQKQNLQTGLYDQQTAQANSQQAMQRNNELKQAQQIAMNPAVDADGNFDRVKTSEALSKVGPYAQEMAGNFLSQASEATNNRKAIQALTVDQKKEIGETIQSLASDPAVDNEKVTNAIERLRESHPNDKNFSRLLTSTSMHMPNTANSQQMQQVLGQYAQALGGGAPTSDVTVNNNAATFGGTQNRYTGALNVPGAPKNSRGGITAQLSPTDQPGYKAKVAQVTTAGGQGAANDEAQYNDIIQSGNKAASLKALTQDISGLAGEVQTGIGSKAFADRWSAIKQTFGVRPDDNSNETKRQVLAKMAAQLRAQSEGGASTDSERQGIASSLPDPEHMGPAAVQQAARYVGALADRNAARAQYANAHRSVSGGDSTGLRQKDSEFMAKADPRVFEYQSIPAGAERQAYLKSHFKSKSEVQDFLDKQQALKGYGAIK